MPELYDYRAADAGGDIQTGVLTADTEQGVVERLRRMGLVPLSVSRKRNTGLHKEIKIPGFGGNRKKPADLAIFSRQLATMVGSGLPLLRCLETLRSQTSNPDLATVIEEIAADVAKGETLSLALSRHPKWFDEFFVSMVQAGESAGSLDEVLLQVADTVERNAALRRTIVSALTYPAAIAAFALVILVAMLLFLVPTFEGIFRDLDSRLPLPTMVIIFASNMIRHYFFIVVPLPVVGVFAFRRWKKTPTGRRRWDAVKLRLPIFGPLVSRTALARFSRSFSVLSRSGVPVLMSLEIASRTVDNRVVTDALAEAREDVRTGSGLAEALASHDVFPPMIVQMVQIGEETAAIDQLLDKAASFYEGEVEARVAGFTSLIEPMLLVFMGATVGGMVVSLYLPMFKVISLIK